jgi:Tol biopolymer transport system component
MGAIAYVSSKKRLVLMDSAGRKRELAGAKDVALPAWSDNGARLAYLQKKDKKTYVLMVVELGTK